MKFNILKDLCVQRNMRYTVVRFSWIKTCLLVWIPCHTVVFLMPESFRVLASAFLSILLGVIIAVARKRESHDRHQAA